MMKDKTNLIMKKENWDYAQGYTKGHLGGYEQGKKEAVKRIREYIRKNCYTEDGFVSLYYLEHILEELSK